MAVALAAALVVVVVTKGSFRRLGHLPVEGFGMLFVALAIQVALGLVDLPRSRVEDVGFGLLVLSYACLVGFCIANLRIRGMSVVLVGIALNAIVIALNQGMPANGPTRVDAQGRVVSRVETSVKHRPEREGDLLTVLDDRILMPAPFHEILSFGDLILAVGLIDVCFWASRREDGAWQSVFAAPPTTRRPVRDRAPDAAAPRVPSPAPAPAPSATAAAVEAHVAERRRDRRARRASPRATSSPSFTAPPSARRDLVLDEDTLRAEQADATVWLATP
jgi:hypothetical protein